VAGEGAEEGGEAEDPAVAWQTREAEAAARRAAEAEAEEARRARKLRRMEEEMVGTAVAAELERAVEREAVKRAAAADAELEEEIAEVGLAVALGEWGSGVWEAGRGGREGMVGEVAGRGGRSGVTPGNVRAWAACPERTLPCPLARNLTV
jgi:hypothetical protein